MTWSISQARAHISEVMDAALEKGPQWIERRENQRVVVLSEADFKRLASEYPTVADLILRFPGDLEDLPKRRPARIFSNDSD